MSFSEQTINLIKSKLSLQELVSESLKLRRVGRNYIGLCPFHNEKSPSFSVVEEEGFFYCFGCGKKGSIFNFVMDMRGLTFPEAVRFLAKRAGVSIEENANKANPDLELNLYKDLLERAAEFYRNKLSQTPSALAYLEGRGLSAKTIESYGLGYATAEWDGLISHLRRMQIDQQKLEQALIKLGLCKRSESGRVYDFFRDRVIFPITKSDGKTLAFGGRILTQQSDLPKYINSPESPIYFKSKTLYGITQAQESIRKSRHVYLVEGYLDVIALHQAGIKNVLASCGTALTRDHVSVVKRLADSVTVLFDGDEAGQRAASKTFSLFLNSALEVTAVSLPDKLDPDSAVKELGTVKLKALLEQEKKPLFRIFLKSLLTSEDGTPVSPAGVGRAAKEYAGVISEVSNSVERELLLRQGAEELGISVSALDELMDKRPTRWAKGNPSATTEQKPARLKPLPQVITATPPPRTQLDAHWVWLLRQWATSVLCEPSLSVLASEKLSQLELAEKSSAEVRKLKESLDQLLSELRENPLKGLKERLQERGGEFSRAEVADLELLLHSCGLNNLGILAESCKKAKDNKLDLKALLEQTRVAGLRLAELSKVQTIQGLESSSQSEEELLALAQKKLALRRSLDGGAV